MHQGGQRYPHRHDWPETDVGAGLPAMRRAGGARSHRRCKGCGRHLHALMQSTAKHQAAPTRSLDDMGHLARAHSLAQDRITATRCSTIALQRLSDRAPPARRIAGKPGPTVCFGPVTPVKVPAPALVHVLSHVERRQRPHRNRVMPTRRTVVTSQE